MDTRTVIKNEKIHANLKRMYELYQLYSDVRHNEYMRDLEKRLRLKSIHEDLVELQKFFYPDTEPLIINF